jgi:hypothetical protein
MKLKDKFAAEKGVSLTACFEILKPLIHKLLYT